MLEQIQKAGRGRELAERRLVGVPHLPTLRRLPEGTFGRAVAGFLDARGLDPENLPRRTAADDAQFLTAHLYETHDIWHVATGFDTDVAGELGLQAFYAAQMQGKLPYVILAIGFMNTFLFAYGDRNRRFEEVVRGWRMGRRAKSFFGVRWDELSEKSLAEVRRELNVEFEGGPDAVVIPAVLVPAAA
jgi:ubiquinone biosynthesis protein Coq4